jgi:8-oxo-dGTP pyrophosphatase MutT (NUDIX family)
LPGAPAPWHGKALQPLDALLHGLGGHAVEERSSEGLRPSAVLVVLADSADGPLVLLTKRSTELSHHRGEMSFPGGRLDAGESFEQAAVREATEEVGLLARDVRIVGRLDAIVTVVSSSYIVPVVAVAAAPVAVHPATAEVERVLWTPFAELLAPETYHQEIWPFGDSSRAVHFFDLADETVWGATARVLHQLLQIAVGLPAATAERW